MDQVPQATPFRVAYYAASRYGITPAAPATPPMGPRKFDPAKALQPISATTSQQAGGATGQLRASGETYALDPTAAPNVIRYAIAHEDIYGQWSAWAIADTKPTEPKVVTAKHGQRDELRALRRAFGQARELIYIESARLVRTARLIGPPVAHEIDLIDVIHAQMAANSRLKVIICTPRLPDFDPSRQGWVRAAFAHRKKAVLDMTAAAQARVAAFHPIGFPGRASPIRSTTIIVDVAWRLTGTSHLPNMQGKRSRTSTIRSCTTE